LADFGIARPLADISGLTATNFTVGTLSYAAPEQLMGADINGRADQYALPATAFHLLTGAPPFQHSTPWFSSASTSTRHRRSSAIGGQS
jgi:serine/threonine protein kinase, bacterial